MQRLRAATGRGLVLLSVLMFALAGCSNPFQIGFGENVDIDRPDGDITSPDAGHYLRGVVTLTGDASDDTTAVPSVTVSFDAGATSHDADVTAGAWSYVFDTTTYSDGEIELLVTITDASGKTTEKRQLYYIDNTPPLVLVKNPQGYATNRFNGTVTIRGEASDMFAIDEVSVRILDASDNPLTSFESAAGTNSWVFEFDSRTYADPSGTLGIAVQATDRAGNVSTGVLHYDDVLDANGGQAMTVENLLRIASGESVSSSTITSADMDTISLARVPIEIDNDLDKPTVSIVAPQNGQNLGGMTLVTGTAYDDDGLDVVQMRLDLNGDGDYSDQFDLDHDGFSASPFEVEANWVTLSGTVLWTQELNTDGELYQVESGHDGRVAIQVRARDINGLAGNTNEISIRFDDTIPRVESLEADGRVYVSGLNVAGAFALTGSIRDDEAVDRVRISYDGGIGYIDLFNRAASYRDASITENAANDLTLNKTIDTSNVPGVGSIASGPLYIRLLVIDNADYQTISYVTLNVDNTYPTATWDAGIDAQEIDGTDTLVQGTATDAGTVSGVAAIQAYFIDPVSGDVYDLDPAASAGDAATAATVPADFSDAGGPVATFDYTPDNGADNAPPYYHVSIDNTAEYGNDAGGNGDGDTFSESLTLSGTVYTWSAAFDSTVLPDGPIELHYVVFDKAGNGTHYEKSAFIKNNRPALTGLTLGTDLNGDGDSADSGESEAIALGSLPTSGFTAVNDLLSFAFTASGANGGLTYSLVESGAPGVELDPAGTSSVSVDTSGYNDGAHTFVLTLTDSVGITQVTSVGVTITNNDTTPPSVTMHALSQSSVKGYGSAPEGHFDDDATAPMDAQPDLSGTFVLSGSVHDDQRISSVTIQIDRFDAGSGSGVEHTVAAWNGSALIASGAFSITSQSLDSASGHTIDWEYEWNTANIDTVAASDVQVTVRAYDAAAQGGSDGVIVDVVPYVTGLDTYLSGSLGTTLSRSALGAWPVSNGEVVTVRGYNLDPTNTGTGSDARLSIDPDAMAAGVRQGTGLVWASVASDFTSVDVTVSASGSGYLTVITNDIASTNNVNHNTSSYNRITSSTHTSLSDDLSVALWDTTELWQTVPLADNAVYPSMTMDGDTPAFAYVNNSEGYGQARYLNGTTDKQILANWDLFTYSAIDFNSSGNQAVLFDINVVNGNYGDYNSGNYGGIVTSFYYDVPAHTWGNYRYVANTIWLDNLVDSIVPKTTAVLDRYQFPDMKVLGTTSSTRVYYSVYDRLEKQIIYRTWLVGTDATIDASQGGRINPGSTDPALYTDVPQYDTTGVFPDYSSDNRFANSGTTGKNPDAADGAIVTVFAPTTSFGDHTAIAANPANPNQVALLYYDRSGTGSLRLVYNTDATNASGWSVPVTLASSSAYEYLDMAIDPTGVVHIGYYDAYSGDVHYVRLASYDASTCTNVTVDSYLIVGDKLSLSLGSSNVPYLAYKGIGNTARVAWMIGSTPQDGADGSSRYNGNWEVQTLPGSVADSDSNRFGVGTRSSDDMPVVGYTDSGLEYQQLFEPLAN